MKFEHVLELIKTVSDSNVTTFKYEEGETKILLKTGETPQYIQSPVAVQEIVTQAPIAQTAVAPQATLEVSAQANEVVEGNVVVSPLVGTFYAAPSEGADAYVKVGDTVKKGQVLAIVEAMKLMNEIESDFDGVVKEILVDNATGVEYGQPLFRIG